MFMLMLTWVFPGMMVIMASIGCDDCEREDEAQEEDHEQEDDDQHCDDCGYVDDGDEAFAKLEDRGWRSAG